MAEKLNILSLVNSEDEKLLLQKAVESHLCKMHFIDNPLDGIGAMAANKFDALFLSGSLYSNVRHEIEIIPLLRYAKRKSPLKIIVYGTELTSAQQLTLVDFGVNAFISFDEIPKIPSLISELIAGDDLINVLRKRAASFGTDYPIDYQNAVKLSNGDGKFLGLIYESFLVEVPQYCTELLTSIKTWDKKSAGDSAHKLKSPLNIGGIKGVVPKLEIIERELEFSEPNWQIIETTYSEFYRIYVQAFEEIQEVLKED